MAWLIGMDEAGYGPNLGPLAIGATAWRVPDDLPSEDVDLYELLAAALCASPDGRRLAIADSKRLYKPGGGLTALECAVHASLDGQPCDDYDGLLDALGADPQSARRELPWHKGFSCELPRDACRELIARQAAAFRACCETASVEMPMLRARLVFPAEFNALVDHYGTKGAALSHVTLGLLRSVVDTASATSPGAAFATLDKHGGRNRYAALVQHHFPEHLVETITEGRAESRYRCGPPDARAHLAFRTGGESFLPTALASMTAKYLRELSMLALNQYWAQHVPGLKPTAGYPMDAKRYKAEIEVKQQALGVDDRVLWRNR